MKTTTIFLMLLLLPLCFLHTQNAPREMMADTPLVFECVSFSAEQGSITITCSQAAKLDLFEFIAEDIHYSFDWAGKEPAGYFPMKLAFKPGKITVKYKLKGEKIQVMDLNIVADEVLKLSI